MKIKLDINTVAVKQLESAIWMFAYNYDEVAVHTVAGAAFEIYTKRLELSSFNEDIKKYIKPEKAKDFISLWNKPYNYFKHGEHQHKKIEIIEYDEETVELIIYLAAEANLKGDERYRLSCANIYRVHYAIKNPEFFEDAFYKRHFQNELKRLDISEELIKSKDSLRVWLNSADHTFLNGTNSPFRDVTSK